MSVYSNSYVSGEKSVLGALLEKHSERYHVSFGGSMEVTICEKHLSARPDAKVLFKTSLPCKWCAK